MIQSQKSIAAAAALGLKGISVENRSLVFLPGTVGQPRVLRSGKPLKRFDLKVNVFSDSFALLLA